MAKKHKKSKKWISWLVMLVLFVAAAVVAYLVWDNYFRDKKSDDDQGVEQTQAMSKEERVMEETSEVVEKPKTVQYDGEDPNIADELSGAITYAGVAGDNLMVRVNIDQYLESGECRMEVQRGGAVLYSDEAGIVQNVTTATCEGFDVPVGELGSGEADIIITLNAGGKSGVIRGGVSL